MRIQINKRLAAFVGIIVLLLLGIGVFFVIQEVQRQQDLRQRAAEPEVCAVNQPTDTLLIFDRSASMQEPTSQSDSTPRMTRAKAAASSFVDFLTQQNVQENHQLGLVALSGETNSELASQLTTDLSSVKDSVNSLSIETETCFECAIAMANSEFSTRGRSDVKKVAIIMTDGGTTRYIGSQPPYTEESYQEAERRALASAIQGHEEQGIVYYTIGFGDDVRVQFLSDLAEETGGEYFFVPTASDLQGVFQEISTIIGKGSITGMVYRDENGNGVIDTAERPVTGWPVQLLDANGTSVATVTTNNLGQYNFTGICDGVYTVSEDQRTGWEATSPVDGQYTVTINGGSAESELNFGNKQLDLYCPVEKAICRWDPVSSAVSYQVTVSEIFPNSTKVSVTIATQSVQAPTTQYIFDAKAGSTYTCEVSAVNACGTGPEGSTTFLCPVAPPPTGTPTNTPTLTPTGTLSPTPSPTNTPTGTLTPTLSPTVTPTPTNTPTLTPTATSTPTRTPTPTNTLIPTNTPTRVPTNPPPPPQVVQPTNTPTATVVVPTNTPTNTPTLAVAVPTSTPAPTLPPTGNATSTIIGIAASVVVILGAIIFFAL